MRVFVTGAAGFIGSNLVDFLLSRGYEVTGYDNLSTGRLNFLEQALKSEKFKFIKGDLLDSPCLEKALEGASRVYHLAANADVRHGTEHPAKDHEQNTLATLKLLEAMRKNGITQIAFASTGSVYGEAAVIPTSEDCPFPIQTSLYGASKISAEGFISAYCEGFNFQAWIFRFVSILGERYSHGHVYDFYSQLLKDPTRLKVLGDGSQRKSYLYVGDCVSAIEVAIEKSTEKINIFNLGSQGYCEVKDSIGWITRYLNVNPEIEYAGGSRGWVGDNPFIYLETSKIQSLGWSPTLSIQQGVERTVQYLENNKWIL
jgi:UDP-glucose 4-epimerase